jgi:hypothetical protein
MIIGKTSKLSTENILYDDCDDNPPITICTLFGTVSADPQVTVTQGSRCSS